MLFPLLRFAAAAVLTSVGFSGASRAADSPTASDVLRLAFPEFVDGHFELHLMLYHRDGRFHHGYAVVPGRDNLPHRVDVTPARPFEFVFKNGSRPKITDKLRGTYAYHDEVWRKLYDQYADGELLHRYTEKPNPLKWDSRGRGLSGMIDLWIMPPDEANHWGLSPPQNFQNWRMIVNAKESSGQLTGTYQAWRYEGKDETFGKDAPRISGELAGQWVRDHWQPEKGSELARGKDWPQVRGPHLTMAADDCDQPLVDNLHDARLVWVAEEPITDGKGSAPKAAFGFYPANFSGWGYPKELNRCEGRLRIVNGRMTESYTLLPRREDYGTASTSPLLASQVDGLRLDQQGLTGTLKVRVGHHYEAWQIDIKRDGNSLSGTCVRHIAALSQPLKVSGTINGRVERKEDGVKSGL